MKKVALPLKVDPAIKEALKAAANEHSNGKLSAYTEDVLKQHISKKQFIHTPKKEVK